uniref:Synaptogyrin 2 n=1 Tax=Cryptocotyle lingua TaxID=66766 RepID=A0A7U0TID5_9TREM|nr:synaptogyrin 2 [Cryptocotyle lingua]
MHYFDWVTTTPRLEPIDYIKRPQVVIRLITLIFSVIVFAVIHNNCTYLGKCLFNDDSSTCGFGMFLCTTTFLLCFIFMLLDMWVDNISNCNTRKTIILVDYCTSGVWAFLWFITFCLLCNRWQNTTEDFLKGIDMGPTGPRVTIAFSFFTLLALGILVYVCSLAYAAVKLLITDVNNFNEYPAPSPQNTYHGFTRDTDMLDVGQPAQLTPDSSPNFGVPRFDTGPSAIGGVFPTKPVEAYQP